MRVIGIDVVKGSVRSRSRRPVYALVRMEDGEILGEQQVTRFRLLKELASEKPDILAVDSLQEIARDQHELYAFLQALPAGIRLVRVTGGERPETLGKVAARYNISFDRLDPADEARTIARIASLGRGSEVVAFENTTDVVVSRHRSIGKGGWSQNRYTRKASRKRRAPGDTAGSGSETWRPKDDFLGVQRGASADVGAFERTTGSPNRFLWGEAIFARHGFRVRPGRLLLQMSESTGALEVKSRNRKIP